MKKIFALTVFASLLCLFSFQTNKCANIPTANKKIVAYVKTRIGKPEPGGYCFSLVENSYRAAKIEFQHYSLGTKTDPDKECIYPGDILSLSSGVEYTYKKDNETWTMRISNEQEYVIYKTKGKGDYTLAYLDVENKDKVVLMNFNLNQVKKGKAVIYRPGK